MLPRIPHSAGIRRNQQTLFAGLDRRSGAANGAIRAMENLSSEAYPVLSSRPPRYTLATLDKPNGLFAAGRLFWVDGTSLYGDGERLGTVSDGPKQFCALGERLLIWPDKLLWTEADGLQSLEASLTVTGLRFGDGSYAGEAAELNRIAHPNSAFDWSRYFRVGDAVTITGCAAAGNNKTPIIREIDGNELLFYENTFTEAATESGAVTLARTVPALDFLCVNENRVWGCRGDTVCCSKLGDPFNWNVFDGLSTDAWSVESGTAGAFTGCVSFLGYPCFFKEDRVFKVYGSRPSNFEMMSLGNLGVLAGAAGSMAVAGETLYYLSRAGFVAYSGGLASPVGYELGERGYVSAAAGSDGLKYYVSAKTADGETELLVYDPQRRLWHREDGLEVLAMAEHGGVTALTASGAVLTLGRREAPPALAAAEGRVPSSVTFADFDGGSFDSKFPTRLWLRLEAEESVSVEIACDGGPWEQAALLSGGGRESRTLPVPIRRCDRFALRLSSQGPWRLYAMEREWYDSAARRR